MKKAADRLAAKPKPPPKADAIEGFRWLQELDLAVDWFAKHAPELRRDGPPP
jgi:hypothetical protein